MTLKRQIACLFLVGAMLVLASTPIALSPAPALQILSSPTATNFLNFTNLRGNHSIPRKRGSRNGEPAQKRLSGCPEWFSGTKLDCDLCGGESPTLPGFCLRRTPEGAWDCQCTPTLISPEITTVVQATVGSEIATGTYELETLTQFAGLREHITMMTSETAITSSDSSVETFAAVVLAGGVAWFLADYVGSAAAVAALTPPETAENHQDDETCPNPKDKCEGCGGNNGMCTTGTDSGCGCEEKVCPEDGAEDQPECTDETCDGQNGKCTTGEFEGCNCKMPECPDRTKLPFWCSQCGGDDGSGKCKGDPEDNMIWVGCECGEEPDWSTETPGLKRDDFGTHEAILGNLSDITYPAPVPTPSPLPNAECDTTQSSQVPWNVFSPGVYTNFCNILNAGDKTQGLSLTMDSKGNQFSLTKHKKRDIRERTPPPNPDTYAGYAFVFGWSGGDGSCSSDCANVFYTIAQSPCGHTAGEQNIMASKASLDTGCGSYSYDIITPATSPVVVPTRGDSTLCNNPAISLNHKFTLSNAEDAVSKFCVDNMIVPDVAFPLSGSSIYNDVNLRTLVKWRSDGQDGCGKITNADGSVQNTITKDQCSNYLLRAVNNCDTNTITEKLGGTYMWSSPIGCIDFTIWGDEVTVS